MVTASAYLPVWALVLRRNVYLFFPCPWRCQQSGMPSPFASVSSDGFVMETAAAVAVRMCPVGASTLKTTARVTTPATADNRQPDARRGSRQRLTGECTVARMWEDGRTSVMSAPA